MGETKCNGCGKPLYDGDWKSKSGLCRACAEAKLDKKPGRKKTKYWWAYVIAAVLALYIVAFVIFKFFPTPPVVIFTDDGELSLEAQYVAVSIVEDAVKDELKAPSTAVFDHSEDFYIIDDDNSVIFSGDVTAENSFGVPLKGTYIVIFKIWGLESDENEVLEVMME